VPEKVIGFLQTVGIPVSDLDPTTPGVPSVVYGLILLLVIAAAPQGVAGLLSRVGMTTKRLYSRPKQEEVPVPPSRRNA
jgi:hypothetical protein